MPILITKLHYIRWSTYNSNMKLQWCRKPFQSIILFSDLKSTFIALLYTAPMLYYSIMQKEYSIYLENVYQYFEQMTHHPFENIYEINGIPLNLTSKVNDSKHEILVLFNDSHFRNKPFSKNCIQYSVWW